MHTALPEYRTALDPRLLKCCAQPSSSVSIQRRRRRVRRDGSGRSQVPLPAPSPWPRPLGGRGEWRPPAPRLPGPAAASAEIVTGAAGGRLGAGDGEGGPAKVRPAGRCWDGGACGVLWASMPVASWRHESHRGRLYCWRSIDRRGRGWGVGHP